MQEVVDSKIVPVELDEKGLKKGFADTEQLYQSIPLLIWHVRHLKSRLSKYSPGCSLMRTALLRFFKYLSEPVRACGFSELFEATDLFLAIAAGWGNSSCSLISSTECSESELSAMTVVSSSDDDKSRPRYLTNPSDSAITAQRLRTAKQSSLWQKLSLSNKNFFRMMAITCVHVCFASLLRHRISRTSIELLHTSRTGPHANALFAPFLSGTFLSLQSCRSTHNYASQSMWIHIKTESVTAKVVWKCDF